MRGAIDGDGNMTCEQCRQLLNSYIDYELGQEQSAQVEEHIRECLDCRREYNDLVHAKDAALLVPDYEPPRQYTASWKRRIREMDMRETHYDEPVRRPQARQAAYNDDYSQDDARNRRPKAAQASAQPQRKGKGAKIAGALVGLAAVFALGFFSIQFIASMLGNRADGGEPIASNDTIENASGAESSSQDNSTAKKTATPKKSDSTEDDMQMQDAQASPMDTGEGDTQTTGENDLSMAKLTVRDGGLDIVSPVDKGAVTDMLDEADIKYTEKSGKIEISVTDSNLSSVKSLLAMLDVSANVETGDTIKISF